MAFLYERRLFNEERSSWPDLRHRKPELRQVAERAAREGIATYEARGRPWPCGTVGGVPDPSLLVGEAGIGAFYLRLADPVTPSILLLRPRICRRLLRHHPPRLVPSRSSRSRPARLGTGREPLTRSPAEDTHEILIARLGEERRNLRALLEDAFEPERLRYELTLGLVDSTESMLRRIARPSWEEIDL